MADYTLSAKITGDASDFDKSVQDAEKSLNSFSKKMSSMTKSISDFGNKMAVMGGAMTLAITKPLTDAGKSVINAASDFNENLNKVDVAFGDSAQTVKDWADTATASFGLSTNAALEATSLFGDMATSMGLSQSEAADMATSMAGLAGDLSSFKNIGIDQAMTALNGVFTGETESLKQLGIVMTETNLKEFASGMGLVYDSMTQAEKVQLRYNYVMAMSKNAIGDYARTSDGTANSLRTFQASVDNLSIALGSNLLPIITPLVQKATQMVNAFAEVDPELQRMAVFAAAGAAALGPLLIVVGTAAKGLSVFTGAIAAITSPIGLVVTAVAGLVAGIAVLYKTNETARNIINTAWDSIQQKISAVKDFISGIDFGSVFDSAKSMAQPIVNAVQGIIPQVSSAVSNIKTTISNAFSGFDFSSVFSSAVSMVQPLISAVQGMVPVVTSAFSTVKTTVSGFISGIDFGEAFNSAVSIATGALSSFASTVKSVLTVAVSVFNSITGALGGFISGLVGGFQNGAEGIAGFITGFTALTNPISLVMKLISSFEPQILALVTTIGTNLTPVFETLGTAVGQIASNAIPVLMSAFANLLPVVSQFITTFTTILNTVLPIAISLFNQLVPFVTQLVTVIAQMAAQLSPMIAMLVGSLLPVVQNIVTVVSNIVQALMPAAISIVQAVIAAIEAVAPSVMNVLSIVVSVVSSIISTISPIVSFIGLVITESIAKIAPIVTFITNTVTTVISIIGTILTAVTSVFASVFSVISNTWNSAMNFISVAINGIGTIIATLSGTVSSVFNTISSIVTGVMNSVSSYIVGVFSGIQSAWNGLTGFVNNIFSGVSSAVQMLVSDVKGFINGVIGGINGALDIINLIPGVEVGKIPYLAHGTDNWAGGFAYMNEGGRGELTYLPNGAQVIPHDISVQYAKEAARTNAGAVDIDLSGILSGVSIVVESTANIDGAPIYRKSAEYTINKIGRDQRAYLRAKGVTQQ